MVQLESIMKIWVSDEYMDVMLVSMLKAEKEIIEYFLHENLYLTEEDRHEDEEILRGMNILLKYYQPVKDTI